MKSVPVEKWDLKSKFLKELDFLSDHWVNGDDKPPFSFGGWREEVANKFVEIASQALQAAKEERDVELLEKIIEMKDKQYEDRQILSVIQGELSIGSIINKHQ